MSQEKRNIIILSAYSVDSEFYAVIYRQNGYLNDKAHVYLFPDVARFANLMESVNENFSFSLLIHISSINNGLDGKIFVDALKQLRYYDKLDISFTSRQGSSSDQFRPMVLTTELLFPSFDVSKLPLNNVRDLLIRPAVTNETTGAASKKKDRISPDIAVLTALDQYENTPFRDNMTHRMVRNNVYKGRFTPDGLNWDYTDDFILARQAQMGMVDAAFSTAALIHEYQPRFLLMSGVCGGRASKVKMFDIIIPAKTLDYSFGSLEDGEIRQRDLDAKFDEGLIKYLSQEEQVDAIKLRMQEMVPSLNASWRPYVDGAKIHFETMACGPWVLMTDGKLEDLSRKSNDLIRGVEMESYSMGRAFELYREQKIKTLVIKSVMDFTDKNKSDEAKAGDYKGLPLKQIAGFVSYLCTRAIMPMLKDYDKQLQKKRPRMAKPSRRKPR